MHLILGNNTAHVISTANANQLALAMRLNEESVSGAGSVSSYRWDVKLIGRATRGSTLSRARFDGDYIGSSFKQTSRRLACERGASICV